MNSFQEGHSERVGEGKEMNSQGSERSIRVLGGSDETNGNS